MKIYRISKETYYNKTLHESFWRKANGEYIFDESIRKKILDIVNDFTKETETKQYVKDIHLTGSISNYNYTKYSDLDIHILLDFKDINEDEELVKKSLDGERWIWNMEHEILIKGHEVELYFQDIDEPHKSSGLYSLKNGEWIRRPKYNPPEIDEKDVLKKANQYIKDIEILKEKKNKTKDSEDAEKLNKNGIKLKDKIMNMRRDSLEIHGEFGIGNLAFKYLRNKNAIENLNDIINDSYDMQYSD